MSRQVLVPPLQNMTNQVKLISIDHLTHDVVRIKAEKPEGLTFVPGQAIRISFNKEGFREKLIPFTITSLPEDEYLEFVVKTYPEEDKVINEILNSLPGDSIIINQPEGGIHYKKEGVFIAGGSGVAPFIAIFKMLENEGRVGNNKLIFGNKKEDDIILREYFDELLSDKFINVLSEEKKDGFEFGFITPELIKKHADEGLKYYYLCGPVPMVEKLTEDLHRLGVDNKFIVKEIY